MTDHITDNITNDTVEAKKAEETASKILSVDYVLAQIEKIVENTAHITAAMDSLNRVQSVGSGDIGAEEKAKGIADVVRCRETTNQQLLAFYTKVFNDLVTQKKDRISEKIERARSLQLSTLEALKGCYDEDQLAERADEILYKIESYCNDILLDTMLDKN